MKNVWRPIFRGILHDLEISKLFIRKQILEFLKLLVQITINKLRFVPVLVDLTLENSLFSLLFIAIGATSL